MGCRASPAFTNDHLLVLSLPSRKFNRHHTKRARAGGSLALLAAAKFKRKLKAKDEDDEHVEGCECIDCQEKREKAAFTSA